MTFRSPLVEAGRRLFNREESGSCALCHRNGTALNEGGFNGMLDVGVQRLRDTPARRLRPGLPADAGFGRCPPGTPTPAAGCGDGRFNTPSLIEAADTLFIASASAPVPGDGRAEGVDVSHRGGPPGFVAVQRRLDGGVDLLIPDFPGNRFFMTLGNLLRHPRAGLLVPDYAGGELLHLAADAEVVWRDEARGLRLRVTAGLRRPGALPWRWSAAQLAPQFEPAP